MKQLIIGTGNAHKVDEFKSLLAKSEYVVEAASICGGMPEVDETGDTFEANALLKAEALRGLAPREAYVLADDSGLEVDALNGEPGVYSARYAGLHTTDTDNVEKLLNVMSNIPASERVARFRCVLCLMDPDGSADFFSGTCEGIIGFESVGSEGFGYDPVFIPSGYDKSFAILGASIKSRLSHRAMAIRKLCEAQSQ